MKYFDVTVRFEAYHLDGKGQEKTKVKKYIFTTNADSVPQADAQTKSHLEAFLGSNITYEVVKVSESSTAELILTDRFVKDLSFVADELAELG